MRRKIIHIDMDAFYASVEQRDDPSLRGRPVVVAWRGARSVVCAASYEARQFGIRSAMPALRAERLCPDAVFVAPDFIRYREASEQVRAIFLSHTALVEPLSLDEAYLDVTDAHSGLPSATAIASRIREQIHAETALTASAGIAPNKFLAKIASEWRKPNGQFVIRPDAVADFLLPLPVERIPGVGKVMQARLNALGVHSVGQLRELDLHELEAGFGRHGVRLHQLARGIDHSPVEPDRPSKSISAEDTFNTDVSLQELEPAIRDLAARVWSNAGSNEIVAHTVVLKMKTSAFRILTRSHTHSTPLRDAAQLVEIALALRERAPLPEATRYRLVGVGLSNFASDERAPLQAELFQR